MVLNFILGNYNPYQPQFQKHFPSLVKYPPYPPKYKKVTGSSIFILSISDNLRNQQQQNISNTSIKQQCE